MDNLSHWSVSDFGVSPNLRDPNVPSFGISSNPRDSNVSGFGVHSKLRDPNDPGFGVHSKFRASEVSVFGVNPKLRGSDVSVFGVSPKLIDSNVSSFGVSPKLRDWDVSGFGASRSIVATKFFKVDSGLVSIRGWTDHITIGGFALFTVLDECTQSRWFHLVECPAMRKEKYDPPLELAVSRLSIAHPIAVTMELLSEARSVHGNTVGSGVKHFTVDSSSTCVAKASLDTDICRGRYGSLLSKTQLEMTNGFDCGLQTILLTVEWRSFNRARLRLTPLTPRVQLWLITVSQVDGSSKKRVFVLPFSRDETLFEFPFDFTAGQFYHVEVFGLGPRDGRVLCQNYTDFRAELTQSDIQSLYEKAQSFAGSNSAPCLWLYRNKPQRYFEDILLNRRGIMEPYIKDNSGDPGSPINGRIHGLFFMASVQHGSETGEPEWRSAFGDCRLRIPIEDLLETTPNLYFADFYCMQTIKRHYVTLVMTKPGSPTDRFCADRLVSLRVGSPFSNPFLFEDYSGKFRVSAKPNLYVEVLYTEDIDVRDYELDHGIPTIGKGHSTKGGRPKNVNCHICSLRVK